MGILSWVAVGLLAGFLAGITRGEGRGVIGDIIVSLIGSMVGGWVGTTLLHIDAGIYVVNLESVLVAIGGAELLLLILRKGIFGHDPIKESWRQLG